MVRFRAKLGNLRTGIKAQAHAVMAKNGVLPSRKDMWGPSGTAQFDSLDLPEAYLHRLRILRELVERYTKEIDTLDRQIHQILKDDAGYNAVQAIYGVGQVFAAVFVVEIGDVTRFDSPRALCSWAGLTPRHRESDTHVYRGRITKQGSRLVRWAAIEAVARYHGGAAFTEQFHAIAERRGRTKANVAIARKVLTLVYYGLRDGEIRCLEAAKAA
jgi:transposase